MTRALVVFESLFGDARTIAQAIASSLSPHMPVEVVAAAEAPSSPPSPKPRPAAPANAPPTPTLPDWA